MTGIRKLLAAVSAATVLVGSSLLLAQPDPASPDPAADPAADPAPDPAVDPAPIDDPASGDSVPDDSTPVDPAAADTPEVTVPMSKTANLTPAQMKSGTVENLANLRTMLGRMVELRQVARQSNDIIKLNCVNDQLLLYKQIVNLAEEAQTELTEAIAQKNDAESHHYYGQVVLAKEKGSDIRNEAEGCIGEEMIFLGPTEVTLDAPPIDGPGDGPELDWDPPVYASPYN